MKSLPFVIAHRGASADAPENTLAAFREAWLQDADGVECDLRLTKDGAGVLLHDATLLRTAGLDRMLHEMTLEEVQRLDVGSWKGAKWRGEKVPEFDDLIRGIPTEKRLTVEIKGGVPTVQKVCEKLHQSIACGALASEQIEVISFDFAALQLFRVALPEVRTLFLVNYHESQPNATVDDLIVLCKHSGITGLSLKYPYLTDGSVVRKIHAAGLLCCTWTVNDPDTALQLARAGVDAITTDRPGAVLHALRGDKEEGRQ